MIRKNWVVILVFFVFLLVRLIVLDRLPIFTDESIYIVWGLKINSNFSNWVIPVLNGKQPATALLMGFSQMLPLAPMYAARLVSVILSCLTFVAVVLIGKKIKKENSLGLLGLLLAFCPYLVFYDRLALSEAGVVASFCFALWAILEGRGFLVGIILGLGWWVKSTVLVGFLAALLTAYLFDKKLIPRIIIGFLVVTAPLLLNPIFGEISKRETTDWISVDPVFWARNFIWAVSYLIGYLALPLYWKKTNDKTILTILIWFAATFFVEIFIAKAFYARYLVLVAPLALLLTWVQSKKMSVILLAASISVSFLAVFYPLQLGNYLNHFGQAGVDFRQYIVGWSSGYGLPQAANYLIEKSKMGKLTLSVGPESGNPNDAMLILLYKSKANLDLVYGLPSGAYVVWGGQDFSGIKTKLTEVAKFYRPQATPAILYHIN